MEQLTTILLLLTLALTGAAQTDTLLQSDVQKDTLLQDTTQLKEAPESLQKLIGEITAETKQQQEESTDADLELDGMLFDETKPKSGRDFYDYFYSAWEAPPGASNYSIFISEKPYRMMTTQIEVKINETTVFQSFLQPRGDIVEQLAQQAVARTQLYLANYEELMRQLEGEDRSGTGIF
jgi:curli production assembly/transport component CsgE